MWLITARKYIHFNVLKYQFSKQIRNKQKRSVWDSTTVQWSWVYQTLVLNYKNWLKYKTFLSLRFPKAWHSLLQYSVIIILGLEHWTSGGSSFLLQLAGTVLICCHLGFGTFYGDLTRKSRHQLTFVLNI